MVLQICGQGLLGLKAERHLSQFPRGQEFEDIDRNAFNGLKSLARADCTNIFVEGTDSYFLALIN